MDEPVVVFASRGPLEAEVAKSKLSSEGILAVLQFESVGRVLGLTVDGLGLVEVLVAPADAERARAILGERPDDESAEDAAFWDEEDADFPEEDEDEDEREEPTR